MNSIGVFAEIGKKKTFVGAVDWPGWCRSGRDEARALQALIAYGPCYAQVVHDRDIAFQAPADGSGFVLNERHEGNATTDFGAPAIVLDGDRGPMDQRELERSETILRACWGAFDAAVQRATGKSLRKGPRGGGRDLEKIQNHVIEADLGYLSRLAWRHKRGDGDDLAEQFARLRGAVLSALNVAVTEGLPERGPRGGVLWPPRYFVRRVAWHALDHAWEIDDRIE